jgi:hypothetical protein
MLLSLALSCGGRSSLENPSARTAAGIDDATAGDGTPDTPEGASSSSGPVASNGGGSSGSSGSVSRSLDASRTIALGLVYCAYDEGPVASCDNTTASDPIQRCPANYSVCSNYDGQGGHYGCCDSVNGGCTYDPPGGVPSPLGSEHYLCCSTNSECSPGQICLQGTCAQCTLDSQCGGNGHCMGPLGLCACTTSDECASGHLCIGGFCATGQ